MKLLYRILFLIPIGTLFMITFFVNNQAHAQACTWICQLVFPLNSSLKWWAFPVEFIWGDNHFNGGLIITESTQHTKEIIFANSDVFSCTRQLHWYYFNQARGNILLPISQKTALSGVTTAGGLYTACGDSARYDILGQVSYTYNGSGMGEVLFGVDLNIQNNTWSLNYSWWIIQWKVENGINGYFFDTMYGIGKIDTASNTGYRYDPGNLNANLLWLFNKIYIQGQTSIGKSIVQSEREILSINLAGLKTILTSNDEINIARVINTVNRNVARFCDTFYPTIENANWNIKCIETTDSIVTRIDSTNINNYRNKDVVISGWSVFLDQSIYATGTNNSNYLSLYIPNGDLIFDTNINTWGLRSIDSNGFLVWSSWTWATSWVYLIGNFIVNGLILWATGADATPNTTIPFKTYVHGKLSSLNPMTVVSELRENQIKFLLASSTTRSYTYTDLTQDDNKFFEEEKRDASLSSIFSWHCESIQQDDPWDTEWTGALAYVAASPKGFTDSNITGAVMSIPCSSNNYPLTIIDKNIPSFFF